MLMMRLQRVGRKNDPSFRLVVVDKRTGPKSNKNIDILGSYNPKLNQVTVDVEKAKEWLSKGVQPSDTVHNILVGQKVIEGKKKNVLPKKSPIVDESAADTADSAPAEGNEGTSEATKEATTASEETSTEEVAPETPSETESTEDAALAASETPAKETSAEKAEEAPAEEASADETAEEKKD